MAGGVRKIKRLFFISTIALLSVPPISAQDGSRVSEKIRKKAIPFNLTDVRLLNGPFRDAMLRDQQFLLGIEIDRLLHTFRLNAGLPSTATPYGGWEAPEVELRGHSLGHFLTACAFMYASTGDVRFKGKADSVVTELGTIQAALPGRGFHEGYLSAFPEEFIDRVESRKPVWAPYYTLHKIMAGLLDMFVHCGNREALAIAERMADWVAFRMDRLTHEQQQAMLRTEYGGMNDVLANLSAATGNPQYIHVARMFDHDWLFDNLAARIDSLDGLHGNTQIPKMIGAVREYELTGDQRYYNIARFFWDRVVHYRSYVIGGNTNDEGFFPPRLFSKNLGAASTETCNSYNMLKLSLALFSHDPSAKIMDFYERALFNHILASQDPATGMVCYYVPMKPGAFRTYSTPDKSFWCCVGTGLENHAKYGESIYFHDDHALYVNMFIASQLEWKEKGLSVKMETRFPKEEKVTLIIDARSAVSLELKIRYPSWARGMEVAINGKAHAIQGLPGSYVGIDRTWQSGDRVEIRLPMHLYHEAMPDDPHVMAFLYGPLVLAGDLGTEGLDSTNRYGPSAPRMRRIQPITIPALVGNPEAFAESIKPVPGTTEIFHTVGLGRPNDVTLVPFYRLPDRRYTVYWKGYTPKEWESRKEELRTLEARRNEIERLTVDVVDIHERGAERAHMYAGERARDHWFDDRRGRESRGGWFSYSLKVLPDQPLILVCTYRGSEGSRRSFDILVDGEKVARQSLEIHPGELFDFEYPLPEELTKGKEKVTVKFQSLPGATAGAVFEVRVVRKK